MSVPLPSVRLPLIGRLLAAPPPLWPRFTSALHGEAVAARLGRVIGYLFATCFLTGLLSHYQYQPWHWLPLPAAPSWGYRVTQGVHVTAGIALIPLLLVKLWTVYPRLFEWPPARSVLHALERLSVALLVASALVEVGMGFINILGWYPWPWAFVQTHYVLAYIVFGSVLLHIAVKYEVIKRGLNTPLNEAEPEQTPAGPSRRGLSRRGLLIAAGVGAGAVTLTTVGRTATPLQRFGLLQDREPSKAPLGVPINTTAGEAGVRRQIADAAYRLNVLGPTPFTLTLDELESHEKQGEHFPLACVEGWSVAAYWSGVRLIDLVRRAGGSTDSQVRVESFQKNSSLSSSVVYGPQLEAALLATHLNSERLTPDHGYPVRLIAPNRAGVHNTKWLSNIVVLS